MDAPCYEYDEENDLLYFYDDELNAAEKADEEQAVDDDVALEAQLAAVSNK